MRKRFNLQILILVMIMVVSMAAAIFSCIWQINEMSGDNSEKESRVITSMVKNAVEAAFLKPITVSETMSQDYSLKRYMEMGNADPKGMEEDTASYLASIRDGFGYQMVFAVCDQNGAYYTYNGISKYIDTQHNAHDIWYKLYKESGKHYDLDVDTDEANNWNLSTFVNTEVTDEEGNFLGVCGVGIEMADLQDLLRTYEHEYGIKINLVDETGLIQIDTDGEKIEADYLESSYLKEVGSDEFYYVNYGEYSTVTTYMDRLDWYLIVNDPRPDKIDVQAIVIPIIVIFGIGILVMLFVGYIISMWEIRMNNTLQKSEQREKQAREQTKSKSDFLANMSHEIRTPINGVLGLNEMIIRESTEPEIVNYARDIKSSGMNLLHLINDILDFSKIESGKMELVCTQYDMPTLLHDLVNIINQRAEEKGLKFEVDIDESTPRTLFGDEVRIRQIITNILSNAVKYTKQGSVKFSVHCIESGEDTVELQVTVADTGIGMRQEHMKKLFAPFERIDFAENHHIEGTGLGMSITQSFLFMMGSELKVESEYKKGSVFSFVLKQGVIGKEKIGDFQKAIARTRENEEEYEASFVAPRANVLVVDDVDTNLIVFKGLLRETKVNVDMASSGEAAIEKCKGKKYDAIFLDHMMPDMDGVQAMSLIKTKCPLQKVAPIIVLTANAISGAREEYIKQGFTDYLAKPIRPATLEAMLVQYLPRRLVTLKGEASEKPMIDLVLMWDTIFALREEVACRDISNVAKILQGIENFRLPNGFERIYNELKKALLMQDFERMEEALRGIDE